MAQIEFRNATYNALGTIDVEIKHPVYGWIPFTASPNDEEQHGRDIYTAASAGEVKAYSAPDPVIVIPDRVSARQFRMQLRIEDKKTPGFRQAVIDWVATQDGLVQDSFEYSSSFVREEPMMQAGFQALGFTIEQINQFFTDASKLGAEE